MGKPIQFRIGNREVTGELGSAVRREDLYGRSRRIVVNDDGEPLASGYLTQDGRLLGSEDYATLYVDPLGSFNGKMAYEAGGEPVEPRQSSFKEPREVEPVGLDELQHFAVSMVYPLSEVDLEPGIYRTEFNYTASVETHPCLILVRATGPSFLLVGAPLEFTPLGKAVSYDLFDTEAEEAEDDSGDFGFDMF